MNIFFLLAGIMIAAFVFAGLLWSLYQIVMTQGFHRAAHATQAVLIVGGMAAISWAQPVLAAGSGALLILAAITTFAMDDGWSRLLSIAPAAFGAVMVAGLPFMQS